MIISIGVIVLFLNVISNIKYELKNPEILRKFGALYEDANYLKRHNRIRLVQFSIIVFLLRRLFYALIVIFLAEHQLVQQIMNIFVHTSTFLYDIIMRPYSMKTILGLLIYTFDFIAMGIFASLPIYMSTTNYAEAAGRIHIYIIVSTCGLAWLIIIIIMGISLYKQYQKYKINQNSPEVHIVIYNRLTFTHFYHNISNIYRKE